MSSQSEPTHHYILTVQTQSRPGVLRMVTVQEAITPPEGWTRAQVYDAILGEITTTSDVPYTLFFSLERNQL
ncbi:hypothetical protein [Streptomyces sp.]|uniref:hypothetical protein n=1 Tax=Streptomyces sp. TaxID=1931 RepID=UPI002D791F83|nr:hypothetical protein [Streptomyces sp.]HET6354857.1 hypothetical protein [Streptomyces sp.]